MNYDEYLLKLAELKKEYESKQSALVRIFVADNNPYKIGDIVTDHIGSLKIEKITAYGGFHSKPCAVYYGTEVKKDGTPMKRQSGRGVYQLNLINQ